MGVVLLVFWLVVAVLIGFVCTVVGENKGIGGIRWFILSLFIGPLAQVDDRHRKTSCAFKKLRCLGKERAHG